MRAGNASSNAGTRNATPKAAALRKSPTSYALAGNLAYRANIPLPCFYQRATLARPYYTILHRYKVNDFQSNDLSFKNFPISSGKIPRSSSDIDTRYTYRLQTEREKTNAL